MNQAKQGDTVRVHYTGRLENGEVFDSSAQRDPLKFTLGEGHVIPGFEQAVLGMELGESKTVTLSPDQCYGPRYDEMVLSIAREEFPDDVNPYVGQRLELRQENGRSVRARITELTESLVTVDANHPLAGHALTFDIELVEVG